MNDDFLQIGHSELSSEQVIDLYPVHIGEILRLLRQNSGKSLEVVAQTLQISTLKWMGYEYGDEIPGEEQEGKIYELFSIEDVSLFRKLFSKGRRQASDRFQLKKSIEEAVLATGSRRLSELMDLFGAPLSDEASVGSLEEILAEMILERRIFEARYKLYPEGPLLLIYFPARTSATKTLDKKTMARRVKCRPANFQHLPPDRQWKIDDALGILDYIQE